MSTLGGQKARAAGPERLNMPESEFLESIDPAYLEVGDGSDSRPIWTAVDVAAGKVYRLFASGRVEGLGDGDLIIRNGHPDTGAAHIREGKQSARGEHVLLECEDRLWSFVVPALSLDHSSR